MEKAERIATTLPSLGNFVSQPSHHNPINRLSGRLLRCSVVACGLVRPSTYKESQWDNEKAA